MSSRLAWVVVAGLLLCSTGWGQEGIAVGPPQRPIPAIERVCIISIDGLRSDRALLADMPNLRTLINSGTYTFWARTTPGAITLPSHVSMLTGVSPRKHGIEWNRDLPLREPVYPFVPTIFELATRVGYSTALVAGKSKFSVFNKPGALTYAQIAQTESSSNAEVLSAAVRIIEERQPQLLFVHFPEVDNFGHAKGWGSPEQLAAIERTDTQLGELLAALDRAGVRQSTLIIVSCDHGGSGRGHGAEDPRSRYIPWIMSGPGVKARFDLTQISNIEVNTEDTAATACYVLGLRLLPNFDGKPVLAGFEAVP